MYVLRFLCSVLAALVALFRVGSVPSFCARLGPPSPVHLIGASASYFPSQPAPPLVSAFPVCLVPPPSLGLFCSAAESDSRWHASAVNTRLQVDLLDPTPTNSLAIWHESSDGEQKASSFALVVLVGVAAIIVLQQYLGSRGSKSPATITATITVTPPPLPPLVLPPPPPPYVPQPCSPGSPSLPPELLPPLPSAIPLPASAVNEVLAVVAAPARQVAGVRRKSRRKRK